MNIAVKQDTTGKATWEPPKSTPEIADPALKSRWENATTELRQIAGARGWSKSEVSRRSGIPNGTLSSWYDGTYTGRYDTNTAKVETFIKSVKDTESAARAIPKPPGFLETKTARELFDTFTYAQMLPTIAVVTLSAGMGKTEAANAYQKARPHVYVATMRPTTHTVYSMNHDLAAELDLHETNMNRLDRAIIDKLRHDGHNSLLIIDEAQALSEACVNQLRYYRDMAKCGLVFLGNEEVQNRYAVANSKSKSPQMQRRIGRRITRTSPYIEDIDALVMAWGLKDTKTQTLARKIAAKPGALGSLSETIQSAAIIAAGHGRPVTTSDLTDAWENRTTEML